MRRLVTAFATFALVVSAASASSLDAAMKEVERIRGARFTGGVRTVSIERAHLPVYLREQMARSLPYSFEEYMLILESLRLVPPGTPDAQKSLLDLMQQQVLAFYDPLTHVYCSIDSLPAAVPAGMQMLEEGVAVHELTHALQDQRFRIGALDMALRNDSDASLALHSLIEGDASLVMLAKMVEPLGQTLETVTASDDLVEAISGAAAMVKAGDPSTPRYFTESLTVPYTAGLRFVVEAYRRGGWDRVNRVYEDPPGSMREVLHPEEYFAGRRTSNPFPLSPPSGIATPLTVEHLGEWHWQFLVGREASRGWAGDRVTIVQDARCATTVLVETTWESPASAHRFRGAYEQVLTQDGIELRVRETGNGVNVAWGADAALIERFLEPGENR